MQNAITHLCSLHDQYAKELETVPRTDHENLSRLIGLMNELDLACKRIALREKWGIYPKSIIQALPRQRIDNGSSDYRIMEDCETENRENWKEADFDGKFVRLNTGDLIIT